MKTITVKGVGNVQVKPDLVVVSMSLETIDVEYGAAMERAAGKIEKLDDALGKVGFEKHSVKTTNFDVHTEYDSVKNKDGKYERVFLGYECSHRLKVEFDFDVKRLADVLSALAACDVAPELSVAFTVKNPEAVSAELLRSATKNAREKAEILCNASGRKLGDLLSIDYNWGELNVYSDTGYGVERACLMKASPSLQNIDIEPNDIDTRDSATFVWEIA